ncbi:MAG: hypothetical protein ACTSXL_03655 [Alphaproteobacteria bacterium]
MTNLHIKQFNWKAGVFTFFYQAGWGQLKRAILFGSIFITLLLIFNLFTELPLMAKIIWSFVGYGVTGLYFGATANEKLDYSKKFNWFKVVFSIIGISFGAGLLLAIILRYLIVTSRD